MIERIRLRAMQDRTKNHDDVVRRLANYSVTGLFALALLTTLQIASDIVAPISSALVIGAILTRITERLIAWGLKPAVAAFCVGAAATALGVLIINALIYLAIHEGADLFAIPTLLGRRYEINPFLVFLSIVFWSWMWGLVGALLAVPLLVTLQSLISVLSDGDGRLP